MDIAIGVGKVLLADASRLYDAAELPVALEVADPLVERGMGFGLAGEQEVGLLRPHPQAMRLMAVQVVAQVGDCLLYTSRCV